MKWAAITIILIILGFVYPTVMLGYHKEVNGYMTIIHHDSVAMKEDIDDYDLFLIVDTNPLHYNEQNIARVEFTDAQHEQILTFLEAQ